MIKSSILKLEKKFHHHAGLSIYHVEKSKEIFAYNDEKYFIPASNTKILTYYGALKILGDSIPSLFYHFLGDSVIIWGTGDPSFLNDRLSQSSVYQFLADTSKKIFFSDHNFSDDSMGNGWAWDDYNYPFSNEKSSFPMYANLVNISKNYNQQEPKIKPNFFKIHLKNIDSLRKKLVYRKLNQNVFYYQSYSNLQFEKDVPFKTSASLTVQLLSDTLKKKVNYLDMPISKTKRTIYHPSPDNIYKLMMQESDNFTAEQLLLIVSNQIFETMNASLSIEYIQDNYLKYSPNRFIWKDGSGLSRYNLFTPKSLVWLWKEILEIKSFDELKPILASGGVFGTLKNYYKSKNPYVYAKTGTLSNNHSLSGFLITKKNELLIFSFMNNNYLDDSYKIKKEMEKILKKIHLKY